MHLPAAESQQVDIDLAIRRVQGGDREAYRPVIDACEARLRLLVAGILPDPAAVEDVVQQAFVVAYGKIGRYQAGTGFLAWIATIARYEALNERRRWLSERAFKRRYGDELRIEQALGEAPELGGSIDERTVASLHLCIDSLQERAAEVIRAHYFASESNDSIAEKHGRTAAWVRLVLHRARQAIGDCLRARQVTGHAE